MLWPQSSRPLGCSERACSSWPRNWLGFQDYKRCPTLWSRFSHTRGDHLGAWGPMGYGRRPSHSEGKEGLLSFQVTCHCGQDRQPGSPLGPLPPPHAQLRATPERGASLRGAGQSGPMRPRHRRQFPAVLYGTRPGRCLLLCSPGNRSQEPGSPLCHWPDR